MNTFIKRNYKVFNFKENIRLKYGITVNRVSFKAFSTKNYTHLNKYKSYENSQVYYRGAHSFYKYPMQFFSNKEDEPDKKDKNESKGADKDKENKGRLLFK